MTDDEVIREAVELAEGWEMHHDDSYNSPLNKMVPYMLYAIPEGFKDALAAQLVRQVDRMDRGAFHCEPTRGIVCEVSRHYPFAHQAIEVAEGPDRTMNTLRAIVEAAKDPEFRERLTK